MVPFGEWTAGLSSACWNAGCEAYAKLMRKQDAASNGLLLYFFFLFFFVLLFSVYVVGFSCFQL